MNLFIRLLITVARAFFASKILREDLAEIAFRVWPNDLDINLHLTNARYLSIMDLGRVDMIIRMGMFSVLKKNGWYPVIGGSAITYKKSLKLFQKANLTTRIVGWDEKWIYMVQHIFRNNEEIAVSSMKTLFMSTKGRVPIVELADALGLDMNSPPIPTKVKNSLEAL